MFAAQPSMVHLPSKVHLASCVLTDTSPALWTCSEAVL